MDLVEERQIMSNSPKLKRFAAVMELQTHTHNHWVIQWFIRSF